MASTGTAPRPRRRWLRRLTRALAAFLILTMVLFITFVLWFRHAAQAALPALDGALPVAGLSAPVTVIRDPQGVPHITAAGMQDLIFAQGFITAQDRLWQMDMSRRLAAGELAEIFGPSAIAHDRQQRILGTRQIAARATAALPPEERALYDAYADGVNAWIEQARSRLPIEFRVLMYEPKPWQPEDSLLVGVNLHQVLTFYNLRVELAREKIYAKLGKELADDLYPSTSVDDRWPGAPPSPAATPQPIGRPQPPRSGPLHWTAELLLGRPLELPEFAGAAPGSNNWVVSGAHTASGKPMLANDMHLPHSMPGIWYEAHLELRGEGAPFNVAGVSLPGLPFIVGGHNQRIAWGYTNLGADVVDVFIERFNDRGEYQAPDGWRPPERRTEHIAVRAWRDRQVEVLSTRNGPIITPLLKEESRQLSVRLAAADPQTIRAPLLDINRAQDWNQFRAAIAHFGGPTQNLVYADVDGNIGYTAMGMVPVRRQGDGAIPVPGETDDFAWTGYVPFEELPHVLNPPGGIIATANSRIAPDGYRYLLTTHWAAPDRTRRIYALLERGEKFTRERMLAIQMDIFSGYDLAVARHFAAAVDAAPATAEGTRRAAAVLREWDGQVRADAAAPAIVATARRHLNRLLLEPRLGELQRDYRWFMSSTALRKLLSERPTRWLSEKYKTYDALLVAAFESALDEAGTDPEGWTYGKQFTTSMPHPLFGTLPIVRGWTGIRAHPLSGNGSTVKQIGPTFGPSQRLVADLADWDRTLLNVVTGQSGQPFSPHYTDHWSAWYEGGSFELPFSAAAVNAAARHRLELRPAK